MSSANIEIKARCNDLSGARIRAQALATEWVGIDRQVDTYFRTRVGRLKLRESERAGAQLIPYLRPDEAGPRRSDYQVLAVEDPEETKRLFSVLLGVHVVVRKQREIALVDHVRIHLDRVEGLGGFVELEAVFDRQRDDERAERTRVTGLMEALGIRTADLVDTSYEELVRRNGEEPGRRDQPG